MKVQHSSDQNNIWSRFFEKGLNLLILATFLISLAPVTSMAQLEEVLVTAERREQSLQEVAISATVLSADAIEAKGIRDVYDLQEFAPNLAVTDVGRSVFINIRGVGIARSSPTGGPGVATYIDGQYISHEMFVGTTYYDLASIEILRGPQGTLTGQNSTGGAMYLRTPEPEYDSFSGYIDQTVADASTYVTTAAINVPLSDSAAMRIAANYDNHDSFWDCSGCPTQPGDGESFAARVNLQWEPNDRTKLNFRVEGFQDDTSHSPINNRDAIATLGPFVLQQDAPSIMNRKGLMVSGEARIDLTDAVQLRVQLTGQDFQIKDVEDGDRTATEPPRRPGPGNGRIAVSQSDYNNVYIGEVNLLSTGAGPLRWVLGAFYYSEDIVLDLRRDDSHTTEFVSSNSTIWFDPLTNESKSIFGQADYRFNDKFEGTFGLRYSKDKQTLTRLGLPGPPFLYPGCFPCTNSVDDSETTGRVGLKYFATDASMFYVTVSRGYKAGGLNPALANPPFGPETNTSYEGGWKSTLAEGRLRVNAAVFYMDYKGIQLPALAPPAPGLPPGIVGPTTENSSPVDNYGFELEFAGAFEQLDYDFGIAYLSSKLSEDAVLTDPATNALGVVASGTRMPWAPEWSANGGIQHTFEMGKTQITPRLQMSYLADQWASPYHYSSEYIDSHFLVDLRVAIVPSEAWRFEVFARNLFDETYVATQRYTSSSADGGPIYGNPRQVGVRARYTF